MTDWTTARVTPEMQAELRRAAEQCAAHPDFPQDGIGSLVRALPALLDAAELLADVRDQVTRGALCPMCSTGMIRRTVGLVCQLCGTDYSRPKYASMRVNALPALLDAAAERDRLAEAIERVRALHRPVGIYDECACSDEAKAEGHEDVEDVGLTCNRMYTVCAECCRDDVYQTEDCASYHDHRPDEAHHCPTIRAIDATQTGGES